MGTGEAEQLIKKQNPPTIAHLMHGMPSGRLGIEASASPKSSESLGPLLCTSLHFSDLGQTEPYLAGRSLPFALLYLYPIQNWEKEGKIQNC